MQYKYWFPCDPIPEEIPDGVEYFNDVEWKKDTFPPSEWSYPRRWETCGTVFGLLSEEERERLKQAHADGKTIQIRWYENWIDDITPGWIPYRAYRIKPEKWVIPTDADCPCQAWVRNTGDEEWRDADLRAVDEAFFAKTAGGWQWWNQCRIRKEEKA